MVGSIHIPVNRDIISVTGSLVQNHELFTYWCCLLITFANSLESDQARQNVGPDQDSNCLTL